MKNKDKYDVYDFGEVLKELEKHYKRLVKYNGLKKYKDEIKLSEGKITFYLGGLVTLMQRREFL